MDVVDLNLILASFGGGLFAASLGIIGAFAISGAMILIGVAAAAAGYPDILGLAFGAYTGPHIAFAAAVAATAYAGRKGLIDAGTDVLTPLAKFKRFDILLIGGLFGVLAYLCNELLVAVKLPLDTIALTVVISNVISRLIFGKSGLFGRTPKEIKLIPEGKDIAYLLVLGLGVGLISSYATQVTGDQTIGFGFSAITLIFLFVGDFPVTHHISISAAYASFATGSILVGGLFGALAALLGAVIASSFNSNADTYIDFPAPTIAILSLVVFAFMTGV